MRNTKNTKLRNSIIRISVAGVILVFLFLTVPNSTSAAAYRAGDVIKCAGQSAVYYYGSDNKKYPFPSEDVYATWYSRPDGKADFSRVIQIERSVCPALVTGKRVPVKPGAALVKWRSSPNVYAVDMPGANGRPVILHVTSEPIARQLYGNLWNQGYWSNPVGVLRWLPDVQFADYEAGSPLTSTSQFNPTTVRQSANIETVLGIVVATPVPVPAPIPAPNPTPTPTPSPSPTPAPTGGSVGVTDPYRIMTQSALSLPAFNVSVTEPDFNTTLRRIGNATAGNIDRHIYSQLQAFNADATLMMMYQGPNGNANTVIKDVTTGQNIRTLPTDLNSPRWNPANREEVIFFDDNADTVLRIQKMNVRTGVRSTVATLTGYQRVSPSISFEEMSRDGRWIGLLADNNKFIAYNVVENRFGARLTLGSGVLTGVGCSATNNGPNWVGISPSGRYMDIQWNRDGSGACEGVQVFDIETGAYLGHVADNRQHSDKGIDENGNDVYVSPYFGSSLLLAVTRYPGSRNFSSRFDKVILDTGWNHIDHISCQGPNGVCVITGGGTVAAPFGDEAYLVYTSGSAADNGQNNNAKIRRLAHIRSTASDYFHQPQASMARNGAYVVFTSDWGNANGGANDYLIDLRGKDISAPAVSGGISPTPTPAPAPTPSPTPTPVPTTVPATLPVTTYTTGSNTVDFRVAATEWFSSVRGTDFVKMALNHAMGAGTCGAANDFTRYDFYLDNSGIGGHIGTADTTFTNGSTRISSDGCQKGTFVYQFRMPQGQHALSVCITNTQNTGQRYCKTESVATL